MIGAVFISGDGDGDGDGDGLIERAALKTGLGPG
jgi:hypothetical protein